MTCGCGHEYEATNQHTVCPSCGKAAGTYEDRDDDAKLAEFVEWFEDWNTSTYDGREESDRDRDYYNGVQWTEEQVKELKKRGQAPIVKNFIFRRINSILGGEVQNRNDPKALPRTQAHDQDAEAITDALRYVCDDQDFDRVASISCETGAIEGIGAGIVEHEVVGDEVNVIVRPVPYDRVWWDPHSRQSDFSDAKYLGVSVWKDLDDALTFYADRDDTDDDYEENLRQACGQQGDDSAHEDRPLWNSGKRDRLRIVEVYYQEGGKWNVCHFTKAGFIVPPKPTGYVDDSKEPVDQCPLRMWSAYVDRDGNRYGIARPMIGSQDEINKRSSKALHILSTRQIWAEDGAIIDVPGARIQAAKPDGFIEVRPNALRDGSIKIESTADMGAAQMQLLQEAKQEINSIGPTTPQLANIGASASGRSIDVQQKLGALELARFHDNHKRWRREMYRQIWFRIRQFWTNEKWFRVTDDAERTGFRFVGLNRVTTRAERFVELLKAEQPFEVAAQSVLGWAAQAVVAQVQQAHDVMMQQDPSMQQLPPEQHQQMVIQMFQLHPTMQEPMRVADVAQIDVDIVIEESPDVAILQQEEYEKLADLVPSFLQAQVPPQQLLEMMLEASQLRNKRKLLQMLRKPPDQEAVKAQQMMKQLQQAAAQAELQKTQAETAKIGADTQLSAARAQGEQVDTMLAPKLAEAEAVQSQGQGMVHAANAGEKIGAAMMGPQ